MEQYQLIREDEHPNKWRLVDTCNRFEIKFEAGKFNETQRLVKYSDCIVDDNKTALPRALRGAADWLAANYSKIACEPPKFNFEVEEGDVIKIWRTKTPPDIMITVKGLKNKSPHNVASELIKIEKWLNKVYYVK